MSISLVFGLLLVGRCESGLPLRREMLCGQLVAPTSPTPAARPLRPLPPLGASGGPHACSLPGGGGRGSQVTTAQPHVASGLSHLGHVATGQ